MRYLLTIIAVAIAVFALAQAYISNDLAKTEEQAYDLLWKNDRLEARYYPKALLATVKGSETEYRTSANRHFRVLAGYIFGGNEAGESIAMTSPVHMSFDDSGTSMSFVMPSHMDEENLPTPNDKGITFQQAGEKYVVAVRFGGWANDKKIHKHMEFLLHALEAMNVEPLSEPWYMGYNPPFQLLNRRNEVAVQISAKDADLIQML